MLMKSDESPLAQAAPAGLGANAQQLSSMMDAINRVQALIEFDLQGRVLHANSNFLKVFGYTLDEVVGQHHRLFCEPEFSRSSEYDLFWKHLASGELHAGEFKRLAKNGQAVWIQASYNPIFDEAGKNLLHHVKSYAASFVFHNNRSFVPSALIACGISKIMSRRCEVKNLPLGRCIMNCCDIKTLSETSIRKYICVVSNLFFRVSINFDFVLDESGRNSFYCQN